MLFTARPRRLLDIVHGVRNLLMQHPTIQSLRGFDPPLNRFPRPTCNDHAKKSPCGTSLASRTMVSTCTRAVDARALCGQAHLGDLRSDHQPLALQQQTFTHKQYSAMNVLRARVVRLCRPRPPHPFLLVFPANLGRHLLVQTGRDAGRRRERRTCRPQPQPPTPTGLR